MLRGLIVSLVLDQSGLCVRSVVSRHSTRMLLSQFLCGRSVVSRSITCYRSRTLSCSVCLLGHASACYRPLPDACSTCMLNVVLATISKSMYYLSIISVSCMVVLYRIRIATTVTSKSNWLSVFFCCPPPGIWGGRVLGGPPRGGNYTAVGHQKDEKS